MITCLTTENRKDRHRTVVREFKKFNIEPEFFYALPAIGPHQSFNLSTKAILQKFLASSDETLLFLEDDVCFVEPKEIFHKAVEELPLNWDILYLGANIREKPTRYSDHLFKVTNCWTTHAILYSKKVVEVILRDYPNESERMYDNYLGEMLKDLNAFIVAPMVAWQSAGHSDIWGHQINYNREFRDSQKLLR